MTALASHSSVPRYATASYAASVSTAAQPRLRLTARGRRVLLVLAATPLVIAAALMMLNGGSATATESGGQVQYVTVEPGQSLWALAEQIAPQSDPREVIADLVSLNGLDSSAVQAGERLAVPSAYAG